MRVLHTSDWHIGHQFHNRKRDDEFAAFLNWILNTVKERRIDALIVAGDVFDSSAPPNSAVVSTMNFSANFRRHRAGRRSSPAATTIRRLS